MRLSQADALARLTEARVARLATVGADGLPHLVPVTFAVRDRTIVIAVDHKPKSTRDLKRLRNIEVNPQVSVLADAYSEDWTELWWVRADGVASVSAEPEPGLPAKYRQYQATAPEGPFIRIRITGLTGWSAS